MKLSLSILVLIGVTCDATAQRRPVETSAFIDYSGPLTGADAARASTYDNAACLVRIDRSGVEKAVAGDGRRLRGVLSHECMGIPIRALNASDTYVRDLLYVALADATFSNRTPLFGKDVPGYAAEATMIGEQAGERSARRYAASCVARRRPKLAQAFVSAKVGASEQATLVNLEKALGGCVGQAAWKASTLGALRSAVAEVLMREAVPLDRAGSGS